MPTLDDLPKLPNGHYWHIYSSVNNNFLGEVIGSVWVSLRYQRKILWLFQEDKSIASKWQDVKLDSDQSFPPGSQEIAIKLAEKIYKRHFPQAFGRVDLGEFEGKHFTGRA